MTLIRRTVVGTAWSVAASSISLVILFVRSVLLARWLPIDVFGVYGFASAIVALGAILLDFGASNAFLHRSPETEDEGKVAEVFLSLSLLMSGLWMVLGLTFSIFSTSGDLRLALTVLITTTAARQISYAPRLILIRRVIYRRISLLQVVDAVMTTAFAIGFALIRPSLWAILVVDVSSVAIIFVGIYLWRPVWRPKLAWSWQIVTYFLSFGSRSALASILSATLDRADDIWTGLFLGNTALGYYSRAYRFATYPRSIVAAPVAGVVIGTYAQLVADGDRHMLSRTFLRVNAVLVRTGFGLAGVLALVAPEFIRLVLGDRWLPMLDAFRLMLVFTMMDPLSGTLASLFVAVGEPQRLVRVRLVQLSVLSVGLFGFGFMWGITGVALAVDLMVIVGVGLLLWQARCFVDYSLMRVFFVPGLVLLVGMGVARFVVILPGVLGSDWRTAGAKLLVFGLIYIGGLLLWERQELVELIRWLRHRGIRGKDANP